jgi:glycosyltransferase involved in cell wall biosynthesis
VLIAFYAPMKPPDHPVPSGDRRMARLLILALERAGHRVELASRYCSREPLGEPERQTRLSRIGQALPRRALRRYRARPPARRPDAWLTYHLYYKAPDWIGPRVAEGLSIPYLTAEASVAPKRAGGPWDLGHRATLAALETAAAVITLNPDDEPCLPEGCTIHRLRPFLEAAPYRTAAAERPRHRAAVAERYSLDQAVPWILAAGMMRAGDKTASYRLLAETAAELQDVAWQLLIVGDGPAWREVADCFAAVLSDSAGGRVRFAGQVEAEELRSILAAGDVYAWPAIREAYGMALLEAQATGLPVVSGNYGGVASIVEDGQTGLLAAPGDPAAFREALRGLLYDAARRERMGQAALAKVAALHDLDQAAVQLDRILQTARAAP